MSTIMKSSPERARTWTDWTDGMVAIAPKAHPPFAHRLRRRLTCGACSMREVAMCAALLRNVRVSAGIVACGTVKAARRVGDANLDIDTVVACRKHSASGFSGSGR
jgi:hypothetical protein